MPGFDGTGPYGGGPQTGWGYGYCGPQNTGDKDDKNQENPPRRPSGYRAGQAYGYGYGYGPVRGGGMGRGRGPGRGRGRGPGRGRRFRGGMGWGPGPGRGWESGGRGFGPGPGPYWDPDWRSGPSEEQEKKSES